MVLKSKMFPLNHVQSRKLKEWKLNVGTLTFFTSGVQGLWFQFFRSHCGVWALDIIIRRQSSTLQKSTTALCSLQNYSCQQIIPSQLLQGYSGVHRI